MIFSQSDDVDLPAVAERGVATDDLPGTPANGCVTGTNRPVVNSVTPQTWATFTHATATTVNAEFQYATLDGVLVGTQSVTGGPISDRVVAWAPDDALSSETAYKWRVRARGAGSAAGFYSSWCEFATRAVFGRDTDTAIGDGYTPDSDSIPDTADPAELPGADEAVPGITDQAPYIPTAHRQLID